MEFTELEKFYQDDAYCGFTKDLNIDRYSEYANFVHKHCKGKVYEIGSGLGLAALALKRRGVDIVATDIFPENARKTFLLFDSNILIEEMNVNAIFKEENSVENFCLHQVMEHIENPENAIKEIYRTLKPNGHFVLIGPNLISPLSSLKCLFMAITGKWNTPWFFRQDNYTFPLGGTVIEILNYLFRNLYLIFSKILFKGSRKLEFREPCLQKPAMSDSDAVNLLNPIDMREIFESVGFQIVSFQSERKYGVFSGSTWIVGKKREVKNG